MAMHKPKQLTMFDVAIGHCTLDDYLNQRYSDGDLSSKFYIEKDDQVDELRQPSEPDEEGKMTPVVVPIQRSPRQQEAPSPVARAGEAGPEGGSPDRGPDQSAGPAAPDGRDTFTSSPVSVPKGGISLADLARGGPAPD